MLYGPCFEGEDVKLRGGAALCLDLPSQAPHGDVPWWALLLGSGSFLGCYFSPCAVGGKVIGGVIDCFLYETAPIYYLHLGVASMVVLALVLPELGL